MLVTPAMRHALFLLSFLLLGYAVSAPAQTEPRQVQRVLEPVLVSPEVVASELRSYLFAKAPRLRLPASAAEWAAESRRLRESLLRDIVFHGWPDEWVRAPLRVEDVGEIQTDGSYRMRKLRYEIVPGFWSSAILYLPLKLSGRVPAVLNVNGHVGPEGKAIEYKQKRCIHFARHGLIALNLEWLSFGELTHKENVHWFGAHLDLAGANSLGLFYLAMRKGLDFLAGYPQADPRRLAVTGLSGGGWQTIVLSALDERVDVSIPVAGYASVISRIERTADVGDVEQNATDLLTVADYPALTAMRAPKPTLLVYNSEDDCCFRAPLVRPYIFDEILPFFRLAGKPDHLAWHENADPGTHNYQLDNRRAAYRFLARHWQLPLPEAEGDADLKSYSELEAGLPPDNLTILGVARKLAARRQGPAAGESAEARRARLREVVRYRPVRVGHAWAVANTHQKGLATRGYRFAFDNGLSAAGVWLQALDASGAAATIVLHDEGKKAAGRLVSDRVNRGETVLAADLLFTGDAAGASPGPRGYAQLVATLGERGLGLRAAQLAALARWLRPQGPAVRLEVHGKRSQVAALAAAALEPGLFREVIVYDGIDSLGHLLEAPVDYGDMPELFCLDLFRTFDLSAMIALADAKVSRSALRP
jgi:dienelactone hydrolase